MDNRKDPYVHPLHQGEFRVILLYSGGWKTPLKCRLVTKMLGNVPQYQALSYAWGFPSVTRPILVDDIGMQITVNLERALMHLRREDADVVLWVDALCINQRDLSEREAQVQVMRNIYTLAASVVVFLGDGSFHRSCRLAKPHEFTFFGDERDSQHIDRFLSNCTSIYINELPDGFGVFSLITIYSQQTGDHLNTLTSLEENVLRSLFEDLRIMLLNQWWNRMWVFQEIIVSQASFLRYGGSTSSWEIFTNAAQNIESTLFSDELPPECVQVLRFFSRTISDIEDHRNRWASQSATNPGTELLALLKATNTRKASDDRDKVYALLGLLPAKLGISPDYYMKTSDVYIHVARSIIKATGSLDLLIRDLGRKNRSDLPTWVPDWSAITDGEEIRRSRNLTQLYNACKGFRNNCWISFWESVCTDILLWDPPGRRQISARRLEKSLKSLHGAHQIPLANNFAPQGAGEEETSGFHLQATDPVLRQLYVPAIYIGTIRRASSEPFRDSTDLETLVYELTQLSETKSAPLHTKVNSRILEALVSDLKFVSGRFERLDDKDKVELRLWYKARVDADQTYQDVLSFDYVQKFMSLKRRLFMTESNMLGWGPDGIEPGDNIYIFPGGKTPFIVRKDRLQGSCYLDEAMDGQWVRFSFDSHKQDLGVGRETLSRIAMLFSTLRWQHHDLSTLLMRFQPGEKGYNLSSWIDENVFFSGSKELLSDKQEKELNHIRGELENAFHGWPKRGSRWAHILRLT